MYIYVYIYDVEFMSQFLTSMHGKDVYIYLYIDGYIYTYIYMYISDSFLYTHG
jgi:hypothetical protein